MNNKFNLPNDDFLASKGPMAGDMEDEDEMKRRRRFAPPEEELTEEKVYDMPRDGKPVMEEDEEEEEEDPRDAARRYELMSKMKRSF